jgi:DNA polymerase III epsilon subunit-like protein
VAHNAPFDIDVLAREGVMVEPYEYIDTYRVALHVMPELPAHRLQYLRYALNLPHLGGLPAHNAMADVMTLRQLFYALETRMVVDSHGEIDHDQSGLATDEGINRAAIIDEMIVLTHKPALLRAMPFGKYKDIAFSEIPKDYLEWISRQPDLSEDLSFTLTNQLKNL